MKKIIYAVLLVIFTLLTTNINIVKADDYVLWNTNIGIYGGLNINMHAPDFAPEFTGLNLRPLPIFNTNKTSFTGFFGAEVNVPLGNYLALTGRLAYNAAGVDFEETNRTTTNSLLNSVGYLDINPMLKIYNILPINSIYFTTGINLGLPINKKYDFTQTVGTIQRSTSGDISEAALRAALAVGAGYIFKISDNFYLSPELSIQIPLNNISSNSSWSNWKLSQLRFGLSLNYDLFSKSSHKKETKKTATIFSAKIENINYYDKTGAKQNVHGISVEEVEYGELFPILPYVFYDVNETEPDEEYLTAGDENLAGVSSEGLELPSEAVAINFMTVDIIAQRMRENPEAVLTITGAIDNKYETNLEVSKNRAEFIKSYIIKNYNIDENRINTVTGRLPAKPSAQNVKDGIEENRRIEFSSNNPEILAPIFVKGDRQRLAIPEIVEFEPAVAGEIDTNNISWTLEITQAGRLIKKMHGVELQPIKWFIATNELNASQVPVDYSFSVNSGEENSRYNGTIPLEYFSITRKKTIEQADRSINKYSLILFDFDKSEISEADKQIIDKYIIPSIKYKSTIDIFGFTDRIGNAAYNKKLAESRANTVKNYILEKNKNVSIRVFGVNATEAPFDNNSPIGRHLSRTVQVYVVTPKD